MIKNRGWKELATEFMNNGTCIKYRKDEIIIRPEIDPPGVFFVESGYLKVYALTKSGEENIKLFKQPGNLFPMLWAIEDGDLDVYIQAITDVTAYRLSRKQYRDFLDEHPEAMKASLSRMVYLYEAYSDRVHNLEFRYARERIAYRLVSLGRRYGRKKDRGVAIHLPIRQAEFADSINVTRETASRELGRLRKRGLIAYNDTKYVILDMRALEKLY